MQFAEIIVDSKYRDLNIIFEIDVLPSKGFVFLYPSWSITYYYIIGLLNSLAKIKYDGLIYIYDIDGNGYKLFSKKYDFISNGYGELFYIDNGLMKNSLIIKKIEVDLMSENSQLIDKFVKESLFI